MRGERRMKGEMKNRKEERDLKKRQQKVHATLWSTCTWSSHESTRVKDTKKSYAECL